MANSERIDFTAWVDGKLALVDAGNPGTGAAARGLVRLRERRDMQRRQRRRRARVGVVIAVGLLAVLATADSRALAARCVEACVGATARLGALLRPKFPARSDTRTMAPEFVVRDADDRAIRLSELRGQVVLLNFWATWCPPCRQEIPWFTEFTERYGPKGLSIVGVSLDDDGWNAVRPFALEHRVNYRLALADPELVNAYRVSALPATVLIDRDGRVAATFVGIADKSDYETTITALVGQN